MPESITFNEKVETDANVNARRSLYKEIQSTDTHIYTYKRKWTRSTETKMNGLQSIIKSTLKEVEKSVSDDYWACYCYQMCEYLQSQQIC